MATYAAPSTALDAERHLVAATADNHLAGVAVADSRLDPSGHAAQRRHHVQEREPGVVDGAGGLDELFGPGDRLIIFDPEAEEPRVGGDGGGDVEVAVVGGPPKRGAQIGQLDGEPVVGLPLAGAVPQGQDVGFAPGEVAGMRGPDLGRPRRWRRVVPRRTGGSSPASKTGSAPMTGRRPAATCAPARRADPGRRSRRSHRIRLPRRRFGGRIHRRTPNTAPAAPFPRRRGGRRTTPPRGAACGGVPGRAVTRPAAGTGDRDDHAPRWRSSTPSARPPTRWPTGSRRGGGRSPPPRPPRRPWPSRSAAPHCGRVRRTGSPRPSRFPRRRPARAPATTARRRPPILRGWWPGSVTVAECARMASTRSAAASSTCSQLSNTNSRTLPSNAAATDSLTLLPGCWVMPSTAATASGTAAGSVTAASSKNQTPSGNSSASRAATSSRQAGLADPAHPGQRHQPMCLAAPLAPRRPRTRAR